MPSSLRLTTRDQLWSPSELGHLVTAIGRHLERIPVHEPIALVMAANGVSAAALLAVQARGHPALLLPAQMEEGTLYDLLDVVHPTALIAPWRMAWTGRLPGTVVPLGRTGIM